jgi:uncharacterized membrane protein YqjE
MEPSKRARARRESRNIFLPLAVDIVHRVLDTNGHQLSDRAKLDLEHDVESLVLDDDAVGRQIREVSMRLKPVPVEPDRVLWLRAMIRPIITLVLTALFLFLIVLWAVEPSYTRAGAIQEVLPVFLGIYGAVIGFWFGEHTAEKAQAREAEHRAAASGR